jgi:hypothetical protein
MDTLIERLMILFGITEPLAIVITILLFGCGFSLTILAGVVVRVKMHADHFDVNDRNIDRAKDHAILADERAVNSLKMSAKNEGKLEALIELGIKPYSRSAEHPYTASQNDKTATA